VTRALLLVWALAGCEKNLLVGMDASIDAPVTVADAPTHCPAVTTNPLPAGRFKLYVNTEGVAIMKCSADDARTNCSTIPTGNATIPPFLPGDPNRQALIDAIVVRVQDKLAPYSVDVITTRPTSGEYAMSVIGGDPTLIGQASNALSTGGEACSFDNHNHVTFAFDRGSGPGYNDYAWSVVSDFALGVGLAPTGTANDCECRVGSCGSPEPSICEWGSNVPVPADPPHDCARTAQDEPMLLSAALGCR